MKALIFLGLFAIVALAQRTDPPIIGVTDDTDQGGYYPNGYGPYGCPGCGGGPRRGWRGWRGCPGCPWRGYGHGGPWWGHGRHGHHRMSDFFGLNGYGRNYGPGRGYHRGYGDSFFDDRCPVSCSNRVEPVCASDGNTYANRCLMQMEACRTGETLTVTKTGSC